MNPEQTEDKSAARFESGPYVLTPEEHDELELTVLVRHKLEEQFRDLGQQHEVASLGMWVFLVTEVLFFGTLFLSLGVYYHMYTDEFKKASEELNWIIGGINTVVLLTSSLTMVLSVHFAKHGRQKLLVLFLCLTAMFGIGFLCLKGLEYYTDYFDHLIPGWSFDETEWLDKNLPPDQIPHVKLFLLFYWIMTGLHALHVTIGVVAVSVLVLLSRRGLFSPAYYSPVDVAALYWHFVDLIWLFLFPTLYLLETHHL
jgi:cytochrome c oxidase subunit 3